MKKFISLFVIFILNVNIVFASNTSVDFIQTPIEKNESILNYGKVTDSYFTDNNSLVIWVQDLHNDPSVQTNVYNILNMLSSVKDFNGVYIEGAESGEFDTYILKSINNANIRNTTVKNLLNTGVLSGSEYFAILNDTKKIYGIENNNIYKSNLKNLEKINSHKQFNNYIVSKIIDSINNIKKQYILDSILSSQFIDLNTIPLNNFFPNLQKQQSVLKILNNISYSKLNKQINKLLTNSNETISFDKYTELSKFVNYNSNYGYAKAYDYIHNNLPDFADTNTDLNLFLKANKTLLDINPIKLIYEKDLLKKLLLSNANLDTIEKEILDLDYFANLLKDLVTTTILPEQYIELKKNRGYIINLANKYLPSITKIFALNFLNDTTFFDFYDTNLKRNEIFINNIKLHSPGVQIIVAGGFHTGLTDELKKHNQSYIVITPNVSTKDAFNQLFISSFKNGTDQQIIDNFLLIVEQWGMFFTDAQSFHNEITKWIDQVPQLKDFQVQVLDITGGFLIDATYNDLNKYKTYIYNKDIKSNQFVNNAIPSKRQIEQTINKISSIATKNQFFGANTKVVTNNNKSLFDSSILLPIKLSTTDGITTISIDKTFLEVLSTQDDSLIDTVIYLLYFYSTLDQNTELFQQFITNNYDKLQQIYTINQQIQNSQSNFILNLKNKIKKLINKLINFIFSKSKTMSEKFKKMSDKYQTIDQQYMIEALKQAELAKQSRKFLKTFFQPPVGGFIINDAGITGQAYNQDNSILHAETLTFINFLKHCIIQEELLSTGELTIKGKQLYSLLDLTIVNGQNIGNKTFQNRPIILENLGINITYPNKRTIDDVFNETNLILKFIDNQLDNPFKTAAIYCTLAPCNKCLRTMKTIGIKKLAYGSSAVNKNHKTIDTLIENGIDVEDGILENETDKYISNYKFMNSSLLRTNIASFIQFIRRTLSSLLKKPNKKLQEKLYSNILSLGLEKTQEIIEDLQNNINWDTVLQDKDLSKLQTFLEQIGAWNNPLKRAGMIYILKNKITSVIDQDNIYFKNKNDKQFNFYINSNSKFIASDEYMSKMKSLSKVKNFADLDDNLAIRKSEFNPEMAQIFSTLNLYGIAQPVIITGNTLDESNLRLKPLGKVINSLMPTLYIENAALEYDYVDGQFIENTNYRDTIAKSFIEENILSDIKTIMAKVKKDWYNLFINFVTDTREIRKQTDFSYQELITAVTANGKYQDSINFLVERSGLDFTNSHELFDYYGNLNRHTAMGMINKFYNLMMIIDISESKMLEIMEALSLLELSRLYISQDPADQKEYKSLKNDIIKIDNGEQIKTEFPSSVRVAISPVRPTLVRARISDYYNRKIQQKYPNLIARSAGQTTISIYKKDINKIIPIQYAQSQGTPSEYIIYTGDEFNFNGVDYPIYLLQQQKGNEQMVVINTNGQEFDGAFISLSSLLGFSNQIDSMSNINRSIALQNKILEILEENIGKIATDSAFKPDNIAQELKNRIILTPVVTDINEQQTQLRKIEDLLKAG